MTDRIPEAEILGKPVRLLTDAQLEAAQAVQADRAAELMGNVNAMIGRGLTAVSLSEILIYERRRREEAATVTVRDERARFERWYTQTHHGMTPDDLVMGENGRYPTDYLNDSWAVWQARAADE